MWKLVNSRVAEVWPVEVIGQPLQDRRTEARLEGVSFLESLNLSEDHLARGVLIDLLTVARLEGEINCFVDGHS
jgi:hypothetical protein